MKKRLLIPFLSLLALASCSTNSSSTDENYGSDYSFNEQISISEIKEITVEETTQDFEMTTSDGNFTKSGTTYSITKGGTYSLVGKLDGQILISAGESDEVVLELNGVSISNSSDSPIKAISGSKVEITAKSGSGNIIKDNRSKKTSEVESVGEGAISSSIDLKLKGSGTLVVNGNYNNGIHTSKDLTIQNVTLKSTGYNNAIKGKDSVNIQSGTIQGYGLNGNGIKTDNSDISSKGNQRGTISIDGGNIYVDSLHDAIDASYDIVLDEVDSNIPTSLIVKTGTNSSSYNKSTFKSSSEKGLKAANQITVNKGTSVIYASDDAIHANYGDVLESGNKGVGNITVNDGVIQIASGDDGLHADNTLNVNGGKVIVTNAEEGFEANYINITGGSSYIYGSDDGVNCSKKSFNNCAFSMSGGYLDVAVKSGDTDGIDSNGSFTLSGGTIVTRGAPGTSGNNMSTGLDVDGTISMTGGTLIAFNGLEKSPSTSNTIKYAGTSGTNSMGIGGRPGQNQPSSSSSKLNAGKYVLSGTGLNISFTNDYVYGSFQVYSSSLSSGGSYTLALDENNIYSWSQSSNSVTIS